MKLYNTLTNQKEEFVPVTEGKVGMYVCGPTVYNYIHIGNARPMIVFDTVRRYFEYKGYEVNYVSNFTDVDDKIINKANEEGVSASEISERFIEECRKDMRDLNVKEATHHPKATEEIDGMIKMIEQLIEKGFAYEKNGTVYFKTRKFKDYGKLSNKNLDDMMAGIRIAVSDEKDDAMDFVLWKPKKEGEPSWPSPWGDGRPGWHIECSVMSKKYIGDTIDIHAGGEDLIFPHHENEIAQSEACNDEKFANYWMHNGFLNIDNKKMSKSAGNFFIVREIGEKYPLQVIRFFMLSAHYRSPLNFSDTLVESAKSSLERILTAVDHLRGLLAEKGESDENAGTSPLSPAMTEADEENRRKAQALVEKFEASMEDDFNTADAIAAIFELVKLSNITADGAGGAYVRYLYDTITELCDVLGIITEKKEELLDSEIEDLIEERRLARKEKNYARADAIREELSEKGILLEDTRSGVKWKRV